MSAGVEKFKHGLEDLGYRVVVLGENRLMIDYEIEAGQFKGNKIRLGFEVPQDFELNPPTGPHISPRLLPINPGGVDHQTRAHESPNFGSEWEYLSRPIYDWSARRTVRFYMKHVKHLLETL